jgi:DNA-binding CsgD family transcriptional regulator/uncharacterized protein YuzE
MTYRFEYDSESGAIYIRLREGRYYETVSLGEPGMGAGVDVDDQGNVLGVEFLSFEEFAEVVARAGGTLELPKRMENTAVETVPAAALADLTPRQREILQLLAEGKSNRQIAEDLILSESTVRQHVRRVLHILGVRTREDIRRDEIRTLLSTGT